MNLAIAARQRANGCSQDGRPCSSECACERETHMTRAQKRVLRAMADGAPHSEADLKTRWGFMQFLHSYGWVEGSDGGGPHDDRRWTITTRGREVLQ